ncbi:MAG: hypothetical protein ACRCYX_11990 [Dermatophilaceae bacterium]
MIHVAETLAIHSVEGFLTANQVTDLSTAMTRLLARDGTEPYDEGRCATMHEIPGRSAQQAMAVYEPCGRIEVTNLPDEVTTVLDAALRAALPAITRALPSITTWRPWTYVEYGPGQHITPHVDGIAPNPATWPRQIAGTSVLISAAEDGGDFAVETTGSPRLWSDAAPPDACGYDPSISIAHDGADNSSPWFHTLLRTRWTVRPTPGTALLYGSQLTHGTDPVVTGRCRKFLNWLLAEDPATTGRTDT